MKKLHVGLVGCGAAAMYHQPAYIDYDKAEVVACCDPVQERAKTRALALGAKEVYTDYKDVLQNPDIDLVDITTPPFLHAPMAIAAAEARKHVFVEKPMAITVDECDQMIRAAGNAGVRIANLESYVFYPPYIKLKELIDSGELGEPTSIHIKIGHWSPEAEKPDIGTYGEGGYPWPGHGNEWQTSDKSGGGMTFGWGVHQLAAAYWLLGDFANIFAQMEGTQEPDEPYFRDSQAFMVWKYRGKPVHGIYDQNLRGAFYRDERCEVTGTKAVALATGALERVLRGGNILPPLIVMTETETRSYLEAPPYSASNVMSPITFQNQIHHLVEGILNETEFKWTAEDGKRIVEIMRAAYKSHKTGTVIPLS